MPTATFETQLLPDGHLDCPVEFSSRENAKFLVTVTFDDTVEASDGAIEAAAVQDLDEDDFLSQEEVEYYMGLEEL